MKKLFLSVAFLTFATFLVNAQEKSGNAAREHDRPTKEQPTREQNREPAMGKREQRGRVDRGMREYFKEMNEAEKAKDKTMEKHYPEPKPSAQPPKERHEHLGKNS